MSILLSSLFLFVLVPPAKAFDSKLLDINELVNHPSVSENSCAQPSSQESVLCDQTFDEFCESENDQGRITDSDIGDLVDKTLNKRTSPMNTLTGGEPVSRSKEEFIAAEKIIYGKLGAVGITKKDFLNRFELIKSQLFSTLRNSPSFEANKLHGSPLRDIDIKALTSVKILTASEMSKMSDDEFNGFSEICGPKGLNVNAMNDQKGHIVVCPGFMLKLLQAGSLDAMDFVIGHELSHTIDPTASLSEFKNIENPNLEAFAPYLSCVENHHSDYFHDLTATKLRDSQVKIAFGKCASELMHENILDPETEYVRDQHVYFLELNRDAAVEKIRKSLGNGFNNVTSHSKELSADMMGSLISSKLLPKNVSRSTQSIKNQLSFLCSKPDTMKTKVIHDCFQDYKSSLSAPTEENTDDGLHPGESYRFKAYMSLPSVRAALGCSKKMLPGNFSPQVCSLEGVPGEKIDSKLRHQEKSLTQN